MKISIVGTGYVGLVSGTCLAEVGHEVVCLDINEKKIEQLKDGKSPIYEPGLDKLIKRNLEHERLFFSTDFQFALSDCPVVFIAVGTPEGEDGSADLSYVLEVAKSIGQHAMGEVLVVVKSTVPVGTCDLVEETIHKEMSKLNKNFPVYVASNPEFLKEGAAVEDFMKPNRIVVGLKDDHGRRLIEDIYRPFIMDDPGKLFIIDRRSSELTKYGSNAMLATRISFMNELARLCEQVGANIDHVRRGMGSDPRIGKKFLYAGPGYGGSCFPKDVEALIRSGESNQVPMLVMKAVSAANKGQRLFVAEKVKEYFKTLQGKTIAVWGLSFKPGTDDVRESPAKAIIEYLIREGASIQAHDPEAAATFAREFGKNDRITYCDDSYTALHNADALVLITEWSEYKRPNWKKVKSKLRSPAIFDLRNQYDGTKLMEEGFFYRCVGRPDSVVKL